MTTAVLDPPIDHVAECPQCATKMLWKGPITDDMLTRTFTRGLAATGLPNCPRCGTATAMVAPNGKVLAPEAITQAAVALQQPHIPGLRPPFDFRSAFESIIEHRSLVRRAEEIATDKQNVAKSARKAADEAQAVLSQLEDDYEQRAAEAAMTPIAERRKVCAFEAATGTPCPICGDPTISVTHDEIANVAHLGTVVRQLARDDDLRLKDLAIVLHQKADIWLDPGVIEAWSRDELREVATWLDLPDKVGYPNVLRPYTMPPKKKTTTAKPTAKTRRRR